MAFDTASDLSDDALLERFVQGDRMAAPVLTDRLAPRVYAQAYRVLGHKADAEDVLQDAMLRLWKMAPDWRRGEAQLSTWLFRVTANLCTDRLRQKRMGPLDEAQDLRDPAASVTQHLLDVARKDALQGALLALPLRQRQAVVLRHIEGLSNPQIAQILEVGVEAVESLTARGKAGLRKILADQKAALGFEGEYADG